MRSVFSPVMQRWKAWIPQRFSDSIAFPNSESPAESESFAVLCCFDQKLLLVHAKVSLQLVKFVDCLSVDLPSHLIGDQRVENPREVAQIVLDLLAAMELEEQPLLLALSSSKFSHATFDADSITQFDLSDRVIREKSPFLASDCLIELNDVPAALASRPLCGVTYANTTHIQSWHAVLDQLNAPIVGLSPMFAGVLDWLPEFKAAGQSLVFCDVEESLCNVLLKTDEGHFHASQLPFGSSLYTGQSSRLSGQFFARLNASVEFLIVEHGVNPKARKILSGFGLDLLDPTSTSASNDWAWMSELCSKTCKVSADSHSDQLVKHRQLYPMLMTLLYSYCCP